MNLKAFVKRLFQICFSQNVPFTCGSFMLVSEIMKVKNSVFQFDSTLLAKNDILTNSSVKAVKDKFGSNIIEEDDEEERFKDVEDASENEANHSASEPEAEKDSEPRTKKTGASWVHKKNIIFKRHDKYDCQERNPLYCGADKTLTFELLPFTRHYHPTVVVFANKLMNVRF